MLLFCPLCSNALTVGQGELGLDFVCETCTFVHQIEQKITNRVYYKLKELDDVLGGKEAWENVDSTEADCPKCSHKRAYFMQIQTRSADEPMTTFYKCCNVACNNQWRE